MYIHTYIGHRKNAFFPLMNRIGIYKYVYHLLYNIIDFYHYSILRLSFYLVSQK